MLKVLFLTIIFLSSNLLASPKLRTGDILLQPLHCWLCSLIEAEENSLYSHVGLVLKEDKNYYVVEAFHRVRKVELTDFLSKTEKGLKVRVLRPKAILDIAAIKLVAAETIGLPYDKFFRWENQIDGKEALYCSELVYKILYSSVGEALPLKRMHFQKNREYWERYFQGDVPDDEWGVSPEDFLQSDAFLNLGELDEN